MGVCMAVNRDSVGFVRGVLVMMVITVGLSSVLFVGIRLVVFLLCWNGVQGACFGV